MSKANEETTLEQEVVMERQALEYKESDEDLVEAIKSAVIESQPLKDMMDKAGKINEEYWGRGTDLDEKDIHPGRAKIVDNRIFTDFETILPIITAKTPEPTIIGDIPNELRERMVKALSIAYEVKQKLQDKLQKVVRHWGLYFIGIWKVRWDDGVITEVVRAEKMGFDPTATSIDECEYAYEYLEDTIKNLKKKFPKKKKDIDEKYREHKEKTKLKYIEFWGGGGEWVAWKLGDILLDKERNPNFLYRKDGKGRKTGNLFKEPPFPYLILNVFNLGKDIYDDTSLISQTRKLQDAVNKRKCQISDLAEENKKLITASSNAISKEEFQKFINEYGMVGLWLDKGNINEVKVEGGNAQAWIFEDMAQSLSEIDNIFGTHGTVRGESQKQETLGGRKLLAGSDTGRIDAIVRRVEQFMESWYNMYLHFIKVYGLEDEEFSDGEETVKLSPEEIPNGVIVMVKKGSTLPVDKASRAEMAGQLAKADFIDPETLFEELGYGKPEERADKLFEWLRLTGKIQPEQPGGAEGANNPQAQQLERLKQIMSSPEFKKLPKEKQQQMVQTARQVVAKIKGGGGAQ